MGVPSVLITACPFEGPWSTFQAPKFHALAADMHLGHAWATFMLAVEGEQAFRMPCFNAICALQKRYVQCLSTGVAPTLDAKSANLVRPLVQHEYIELAHQLVL